MSKDVAFCVRSKRCSLKLYTHQFTERVSFVVAKALNKQTVTIATIINIIQTLSVQNIKWPLSCCSIYFVLLVLLNKNDRIILDYDGSKGGSLVTVL